MNDLKDLITDVGVKGAEKSLAYLRENKLVLPWDPAGEADEFISSMGLMLTRTSTGAFILWFFAQESPEMDTDTPYQVFATYINEKESWITGNFNNIDPTFSKNNARITEEELLEIISLSVDLEPITSDTEYLELFQALHLIVTHNQNKYFNVEELVIDIKTVSIEIPDTVLEIAKKYLGDVVHAK